MTLLLSFLLPCVIDIIIVFALLFCCADPVIALPIDLLIDPVTETDGFFAMATGGNIPDDTYIPAGFSGLRQNITNEKDVNLAGYKLVNTGFADVDPDDKQHIGLMRTIAVLPAERLDVRYWLGAGASDYCIGAETYDTGTRIFIEGVEILSSQVYQDDSIIPSPLK